MFGIFKSKYNLINSRFNEEVWPISLHILRKVDDGSPDIKCQSSLLRYMKSMGLRSVAHSPYHGGLSHGWTRSCSNSSTCWRQPIPARWIWVAVFWIYDGMPLFKQVGWRKCYLWAAATCWSKHPTCPPPGLPDIPMKIWNAGYQPVITRSVTCTWKKKDYLLLKRKVTAQLNLRVAWAVSHCGCTPKWSVKSC